MSESDMCEIVVLIFLPRFGRPGIRLHLQEVWISFVDQGFVADPGSKPSHATSHIIIFFAKFTTSNGHP